MRTLKRLVVLALVSVPLAGCASHGIQMVNKTGKTLNVEYLHVNKDGTVTTPYATSILTVDGELKYYPPVKGEFVGERVRLVVADSPETQGHSILLNVPAKKGREVDIQYTAGRLYVYEYKKGRDWAQTSEPAWE